MSYPCELERKHSKCEKCGKEYAYYDQIGLDGFCPIVIPPDWYSPSIGGSVIDFNCSCGETWKLEKIEVGDFFSPDFYYETQRWR